MVKKKRPNIVLWLVCGAILFLIGGGIALWYGLQKVSEVTTGGEVSSLARFNADAGTFSAKGDSQWFLNRKFFTGKAFWGATAYFKTDQTNRYLAADLVNCRKTTASSYCNLARSIKLKNIAAGNYQISASFWAEAVQNTVVSGKPLSVNISVQGYDSSGKAMSSSRGIISLPVSASFDKVSKTTSFSVDYHTESIDVLIYLADITAKMSGTVNVDDIKITLVTPWPSLITPTKAPSKVDLLKSTIGFEDFIRYGGSKCYVARFEMRDQYNQPLKTEISTSLEGGDITKIFGYRGGCYGEVQSPNQWMVTDNSGAGILAWGDFDTQPDSAYLVFSFTPAASTSGGASSVYAKEASVIMIITKQMLQATASFGSDNVEIRENEGSDVTLSIADNSMTLLTQYIYASYKKDKDTCNQVAVRRAGATPPAPLNCVIPGKSAGESVSFDMGIEKMAKDARGQQFKLLIYNRGTVRWIPKNVSPSPFGEVKSGTSLTFDNKSVGAQEVPGGYSEVPGPSSASGWPPSAVNLEDWGIK